MQEHEVLTVSYEGVGWFKGVEVSYEAESLYCSEADEYFENEEQISENNRRLKDAYRKKMGLLTSEEIKGIRKKYDISQKDLCLVLGWGAKTITRYESHQVQDRAHDTILRNVDRNPEWFASKAEEAKGVISPVIYKKIRATVKEIPSSEILMAQECWEKINKSIDADIIRKMEKELADKLAPLGLKLLITNVK
ncbi:MAG: hypothetical protein K6G10_00420 [Butyrivibrio sp.]|nr:hypothetical protein [Butyrivibrio sp.]